MTRVALACMLLLLGCGGEGEPAYRTSDAGIEISIPDSAPPDVQPWPDVYVAPEPYDGPTPDPAGTVLEWPAPPCDQYIEPCPQLKDPATR